MPFINTHSGSESNPVQIFYQEYGEGRPVIFIHGWPLNHEMWEYQLTTLPKSNLRCIAYDRRGFGKSDRPWESYDYDTLADDLHELISQLGLNSVSLVGFSMGGGEIVRYIGKYGTDKIDKVVLISSVTPFMVQTHNNPEGIEKYKFDDMVYEISKDRPAFLESFAKKFYGVGLLSQPVSQAILNWNQVQCLTSSAKATQDCVRSFSETDFTDDLVRINVPVLIIHGEDDEIVPIAISGEKTAELLPNAEYLVYDDAPHGLFITEKDRLNADLIEFLTLGAIQTDQEEEQIPLVLNPSVS